MSKNKNVSQGPDAAELNEDDMQAVSGGGNFELRNLNGGPTNNCPKCGKQCQGKYCPSLCDCIPAPPGHYEYSCQCGAYWEEREGCGNISTAAEPPINTQLCWGEWRKQ